MNRIRILPDKLANQIAAGEVIERPASVVKELLENSIDAGAGDILVELENGGTSLIRVRDDGHGISREDLELALQSHATSKIRTLQDLHQISTLGFRGEALPSIAAVAQFQIISRDEDAAQAWQISRDVLSGGNTQGPASHNVGTTVEVRNLFHATPARRKFLRSPRTEYIHTLEMVKRLSLGCGGTRLRVRHNGKQVFSCSPGKTGPSSNIRSVLGSTFMNDAVSFDEVSGGMRAWGWLARPEHSRSQSDRQYFYLNGRVIRDKQVNHAIRMAYGDRVAAGRYPVYVVYMAIDPQVTDVNVHPTKYEVRFSDARDVHDFIYASLARALQQGQTTLIEPGMSTQEIRDEHDASYRHVDPVASRFANRARQALVNPQPEADANRRLPGLGDPVMSLASRYILTARGERCNLVDAVAARRYVVRQRMQLTGNTSPIQARPLLVPVSMTVSVTDTQTVELCREALDQHGLELQVVAPGEIMIKTIPSLLPDLELQVLVRDMLVAINGHKDPAAINRTIVNVFEDHAGKLDVAEMGRDAMLQLLYALEECGLDTSSEYSPGIWKRLDETALAGLLR